MSAPRHASLARRAWLALAACLCAGCAWLPPTPVPESAYQTPDQLACAAWYATLDAATDAAGVRDAGGTRIPGYPHLRMDRFTASLRDLVRPDLPVEVARARTRALVERLTALDLHARGLEMANLPPAVRMRLADDVAGAAEPAGLWRHASDCARRLAASDLASASRSALLLQRLVVPDDYAIPYRVLGLYALTRAPFLSGVRRLEAEQREAFAQDRPPPPGATRLRLSPPARPAPDAVSASRLRRMLLPPADDPLQVPAPTPEELDILFAHFAPSFEIDIASNDDRPGALAWREQGAAGAAPWQVDTTTPVVYRHTAHTRHRGGTLLQLVYTVWFPARTPTPGAWLDLLAGPLDGLVLRVTLAPDGTPLVYDSIHPCGCYHMFFPTAAAQALPAPAADIEWAFSPRAAPVQPGSGRMVLRLAAGTHYLERVSTQSGDDSPLHYGWRDYDTLRSMPLAGGGRRNLFGPEGFVEGTDRPESFVFWPMGIRRAGAMRQWGRHATAFVGRRHFDDAYLMEQRFVFAPEHFRP